MKHISKIGMIAMAGGLLAVTSCSDFSDYNSVPEAYESTADKTLWENISGNANLSEFAAVLQRVGYDKVLSASHTYTVWAPVNGSFNIDSLNNLSDEKVKKEFVENLVADYAHRETDINDTTIYMLNEKLLKFANKGTGTLAFDSKSVLRNINNTSVYNYPSVNGLLYTVENPATFRYNGYEIISEKADIASKFANYVKKYEVRTLDETNSVKGEIIDGQQHYDDSVMIVHNTMTQGQYFARLNNEDSLYTVLIPNDAAWTAAYNKISKYYNYLPSMTYQDLSSTEVGNTKGGNTSTSSATIMAPKTGATTVSLASAPSDAEIQETAAYWTDSISKSYLVRYNFFSETNKKYNAKLSTGAPFVDNDTLYTSGRNYITNLTGLNTATEQTIRLSNGHARILNAYPYADEAFLPRLDVDVFDPSRLVTAVGTGTSRVTLRGLPEAVWKPENGETSLVYLETQVPTNSSYAPELDYYLKDVRSATYDVYIVMVPAIFDGEYRSLSADIKPYSLRVDINYTDASNNAVAGRFDGTGIQTTAAGIKSVRPFIVNCKNENGVPCVDTLHVGKITFPVSYYRTGVAPNIKVMHTFNSFLSTQKRNYEQNLRIAGIILKPVYETDENAIKED